MTAAEERAADERPAEKPTGRRRRRRLLIVLTGVIIVFTAVTARMFVWPDLPPLPERADAIIELGGAGKPLERDDAALALAREHRAPVLVQSTVREEAGTSRCLAPVPDVTIMCFHAEPNTTRGEAHAIAAMAARYNWKSVILVTSPDHAWRARLRVSRCFPGEVYVSTFRLPPLEWFRQIPYQWGASTKALLFEREC
jgi:uncharacterized SAM-binding protein YcdF (DUF218 family)